MVYKQYLTLTRAEESFAKQKSRIQWLQLGDQCTSFFFKYVNNLINKSKITSLVLEDGTVTQDIGLIKATFVNSYVKLLGTPHISPHLGSSRIQQLINKKLSPEQSLTMISVVTNLEIKETFQSLNPNKAPGPDGYNSCFS